MYRIPGKTQISRFCPGFTYEKCHVGFPRFFQITQMIAQIKPKLFSRVITWHVLTLYNIYSGPVVD